MKFENIYKETEENMRLALLSLWAPGSHPMRSAIDELFDREPLLAEPVFQSTFGWEPSSDETWRSAINRDVWNKLEKIRENKAIEAGKTFRPFVPFKHQAESWKTLAENKSIVVTSGTGSGKTECFMYPVLSDLYEQGHTNAIEAIFLYPLNALMERNVFQSIVKQQICILLSIMVILLNIVLMGETKFFRMRLLLAMISEIQNIKAHVPKFF